MKPEHEECECWNPPWAYVNAKYGSRMPRNRSTISNVKVIHYPSIARLQVKQAGSWNGSYSRSQSPRFIGQTAIFCGKSPGDEVGLYHADWFVAVHLLIFHILMIPNKDAPGSWQLSANCPVIWLCTWVRYWPGRGLVYVPASSPGRANCC